MKTFFAVFFGILAAVVAIALARRWWSGVEARQQASMLRTKIIAMAKAGCHDADVRDALEDELSREQDAYRNLVFSGYGADEAMLKDSALASQIAAQGCFQVQLPTPHETWHRSRSVARHKKCSYPLGSEWGTITIDSKPEGAKFDSDVLSGTTPETADIPPGRHHFVVSPEGHPKWEKYVCVEPSSNAYVFARLRSEAR